MAAFHRNQNRSNTWGVRCENHAKCDEKINLNTTKNRKCDESYKEMTSNG